MIQFSASAVRHLPTPGLCCRYGNVVRPKTLVLRPTRAMRFIRFHVEGFDGIIILKKTKLIDE